MNDTANKVPLAIEDPNSLKPLHQTRPAASYTTCSRDVFHIQKRSFNQQFNDIYILRTKFLRKEIENTLRQSPRFANMTIVDSVLKLDVSLGKCIVIGTLYKSQQLKPNILLEYTREKFIEDADIGLGFQEEANRTSESDFLILEDEYGRARLTFAQDTEHNVGQFVTGIVVACLGEENEAGDFIIDEIIFPGMAPQPPLPLQKDDVYVAFMSGISISHDQYKPALVQVAVDFITGAAGCTEEQRDIISKIARVVIVGNSVSPPEVQMDMFGTQGSLRVHDLVSMVGPMNRADQLFAQLGQSVHVDIMPGNKDPSNQSLPQSPIHHSILPVSSSLSTVHLATNPHSFIINGVHMLGSSGESVQDIKQFSAKESTLEIMEDMMRYRHLAPTAPDTLNCYPFQKEDPFIIHATPHVFFVGNQSHYESKFVQGEKGQSVRLISIPSFVETSTIVLVNLRTLSSHPIRFDIDVI